MTILSVGADLQMPAGKVMGGRVQGCYEHAAHLLLDDGRQLTLLSGTTQRGMRVVNLAEPDWPTLRQHLNPGDAVSLTATALQHASFALPMRGVAVWRAPEVSGAFSRLSPQRREEVFLEYAAWIEARLSVLVASVPESAYRLWHAAFAAFAMIADAMHACADPNASSVALDLAVEKALGLGPGLTPSADDMVAGFLTGLRAAQAPESCVRLLARSVRCRWCATSIVSRDVLAQAMRGWTSSRMADVCAALARTSGAPVLRDVLDAQAAVGRYSGLDTLVGFFAGLDTCRDEQLNDPTKGRLFPAIFHHACLRRALAPTQQRMFA